MSKLVIGIILLSLFLLVVASNILLIIIESPNPAQLQVLLKGMVSGWLVTFIILGVPGILLTYFGNQSIKLQRSVLANAIQMLYKEKEIDISSLSANNGLSDKKTKKIIANLQRKGIMPSEIQI